MARTIKAIGKGLLKILSKMGISTIRSYTGAQIFEAVGLEKELVDRHFTGTPSRVGGVGLNVLAWECLDRHARAYPAASSELLPAGGVYAWRRDGEFHGWNPETIATLQQAAREEGGGDAYERFATYVNEVAVPKSSLRGLLRFNEAPSRSRSTRSSRRPRSSSASSRAACRSARSRRRRTRRSPPA